MSRICQLALRWQAQAEQDAEAAQQHTSVREQLLAHAMTRRNCAWELLRTLRTLDEENPAEAGSLGPQTRHERG